MLTQEVNNFVTLKRISVGFHSIICLNFSYKHKGVRDDIPKYSHAWHNDIMVNERSHI